MNMDVLFHIGILNISRYDFSWQVARGHSTKKNWWTPWTLNSLQVFFAPMVESSFIPFIRICKRYVVKPFVDKLPPLITTNRKTTVLKTHEFSLPSSGYDISTATGPQWRNTYHHHPHEVQCTWHNSHRKNCGSAINHVSVATHHGAVDYLHSLWC